MTPVIERTQIDFAPDRFSTSPRTLPVSGKPAAPPVETRPTSRSGHALTFTNFNIGTVPRTNPKGAGRPSEISLEVCETGGLHHWHSKGIQVRCANCKRTAFKALIGSQEIHQMRYKLPITLKYAKGIRKCTGVEHKWMRDGAQANGRLRAKCRLCRVTAERVEPVSGCHLHAKDCDCPAYLIAMGANDAVVEADLEAGE